MDESATQTTDDASPPATSDPSETPQGTPSVTASDEVSTSTLEPSSEPSSAPEEAVVVAEESETLPASPPSEATTDFASSPPTPPQTGESQPEPPHTPTPSSSTTSTTPPVANSTTPSPEIEEYKFTPPPRKFSLLFLEKARMVMQLNKKKKMEKIMALFEKREFITNDMVQKLLKSSDSTAVNYLARLVKQGKIVRIGSGRITKYRKA